MKSTIVEVTNGPLNWGKFLVAVFDVAEWTRHSAVLAEEGHAARPLLRSIGYSDSHLHVWVLDLQTREGACFIVHDHALARLDLNNHKIWVCPMFEPFLEWLYKNYKGIDELPTHVDLPDAPFAMHGYRREGQ